MLIAPSQKSCIRQQALCLWLLAATLPRTLTSEEVTGDAERILANSAHIPVALGCNVDVSGHYVSEYGVQLKVVQTLCTLFVDPPGKVIGVVGTGKNLNIASVQGHAAGGDGTAKEIKFSNGAIWTKQETSAAEGWPKVTTTGAVQAHESASTVSMSPIPESASTVSTTPIPESASTVSTTAAPATLLGVASASTTFPWWAVGAGLAVAGVGAIAGGVAAGVAHNQAKGTSTPEQHVADHKSSQDVDIRFMSPASVAARSKSADTVPHRQGDAPLLKGAGTAASPMTLLPYLFLLGGLALLACLAGVAIAACRSRSTKDVRDGRVSRTESQDSKLSYESEDADEEDNEAESALLRVDAEDI